MPKTVTKEPKEGEYTTLKIPNDLINQMDALLGKHGFKSRGEIVKEALRELLDHYEKEEFKIMNHGPAEVKVRDLRTGWTADITFTQKGLYCPICDASNCEHIRFALNQSDVQEAVRKKRKEDGWGKLPDV